MVNKKEHMKRPIESEYTSHVAYARALEEYCDLLVKSEQEPVAWMCCAFDGKVCEQSNHDECENPIPLYTAPPPKQEARNFCPRCGKRTPDLAAVHTCTPPRGLEMT